MEKKNKLVIFYSHFIRKDGTFFIGGIQTYIHLLIKTFHESYNVTIIQCNNSPFEINERNFSVISLGHRDPKKGTTYVEKEILKNSKDFLIYASEQFAFKGKWENSLVIQHGIYWDLPVSVYKSSIKNSYLQQIFKIFDNYRNFKRIQPFDNVVCVDNNYINWYRSVTSGSSTKKFFPVYNCAGDQFFDVKLSERIVPSSVNILFARRFVRMRGVRIFTKVAVEIVSKFPNVNIILTGDGPELEWIQNEINGISGIAIRNATYQEMPELMKEADIVVVPSLGSEGSSLSAIEGMAAGKVVIATNVGGLTNVIISEYNGYLIDINEESLFSILCHLVENPEKRLQIASNAKDVAQFAFNYKNWSETWKNILKEISYGNNT